MATPLEPRSDVATPTPAAGDQLATSGAHDVSEGALWRRAAWGLLWGFVIAGLLGYGLIELIRPELSFAGKFGLGVYVAFWSGPFIGLSGAVGLNELRKSQAHRGHAAAPSTSS